MAGKRNWPRRSFTRAASIGMAAAGGLLSSLNPRLVLFLAGGGGLLAAGAGSLAYALRHRRRARMLARS